MTSKNTTKKHLYFPTMLTVTASIFSPFIKAFIFRTFSILSSFNNSTLSVLQFQWKISGHLLLQRFSFTSLSFVGSVYKPTYDQAFDRKTDEFRKEGRARSASILKQRTIL